jgi:hypothetical protein
VKGKNPALTRGIFEIYKAKSFLKILKKLFLKKVSLAEREAEPRNMRFEPTAPLPAVRT